MHIELNNLRRMSAEGRINLAKTTLDVNQQIAITKYSDINARLALIDNPGIKDTIRGVLSNDGDPVVRLKALKKFKRK